MKAILVVLGVLLCTGCATLPYAAMSPEQITALSKIKDANVVCVNGVYAGATVTTVSIMADKGVPAGITIDSGCKTTFTTTSPNSTPALH